MDLFLNDFLYKDDVGRHKLELDVVQNALFEVVLASQFIEKQMRIMTIFLPSACGNCRLYFPRGVIHHAPNQGGSPSVHLTISSFQRQSLYDLVQKTFEEVILKLF